MDNKLMYIPNDKWLKRLDSNDDTKITPSLKSVFPLTFYKLFFGSSAVQGQMFLVTIIPKIYEQQ